MHYISIPTYKEPVLIDEIHDNRKLFPIPVIKL